MKAAISCQQQLTADDSWWQLMKMEINLEGWNLVHISPAWCKWKFHLILFMKAAISCQQLLTVDDSWWQLMKEKINLEGWHLVHISPIGCQWIFHLFFLWQLSSAVSSCWQLMTPDEYENQPKDLKFGTQITLRVQMKILFHFFVTLKNDILEIEFLGTAVTANKLLDSLDHPSIKTLAEIWHKNDFLIIDANSKSFFFCNKWTVVNSCSTQLVLAGLGQKHPAFPELSLA